MNNRVDFEVLQPEQRSRYYGMTPLPDETTYSFVARAAVLTGTPDLRRVAADLFESDASFTNPCARLHGNFQRLAENLGVVDVSSLLDGLSFLPLFRPFLNDDLYHWAQERSRLSGARGIGNTLRIKHAGLLRSAAAACPECIKFDKARYHNAYYHRVHQISAVIFCPAHGCKLLTHCPACGLRLPNIPDETCRGCGCILTPENPSADPSFEAHLRLARFAEACFGGAMPKLDWQTRSAILKARAKERIRNRSGIVGDNLATFLNGMFGRKYLEGLGLATDNGTTIGWPSLVINGEAWLAEVGPQLLLVAALFDSVADFSEVCKLRSRRRTSRQRDWPRRAEIPWNKEIFLDLVRIGDIAMVAERHGITKRVLQSWVSAYPGLQKRLDAKLKRRRTLREHGSKS